MSTPLSDVHPASRPAPRRQSHAQTFHDNPLGQLSDAQLEEDARRFVREFLFVDVKNLIRGMLVAKDPRLYEVAARSSDPEASHGLPVKLSDDEKKALRRERDVPLGERGVWTIIATVSLAAFLQGHVQSSFNGGALYDGVFGLHTIGDREDADVSSTLSNFTGDDWKLGAANASPFLFAALLGCPLALPVNHYLGRKGGVAIAAFLIFATSIASAFATTWYHLFGIRLVNGIGMGLKAVSTPILASETAVGLWRGTSILAWQLWVACGIAIGFAFNLVFSTAKTDKITFALIMAAPAVPSLALFILVIWFCDESPRYLLRESSPNYNPKRAYEIIRKLRSTELQALRDIYLLQKSIDRGEPLVSAPRKTSMSETFVNFVRQYQQLLRVRRLRNALVSSSIVNLSQQLCGINDAGALGLFSGLNVVAFVLVFFLLEETKRRSLEDLDTVFEHSKRDFARHQAARVAWFFRRWVLGKREAKPSIGYLEGDGRKPGAEAASRTLGGTQGEVVEVENSEATRREEIGDLYW
ncbi:hypothetical protein VdG1_05775 [Verticillium dahliae VDG1]|nr:hypothetical protein VdG1_05775 [Verticillium dahliae VDG1]